MSGPAIVPLHGNGRHRAHPPNPDEADIIVLEEIQESERVYKPCSVADCGNHVGDDGEPECLPRTLENTKSEFKKQPDNVSSSNSKKKFYEMRSWSITRALRNCWFSWCGGKKSGNDEQTRSLSHSNSGIEMENLVGSGSGQMIAHGMAFDVIADQENVSMKGRKKMANIGTVQVRNESGGNRNTAFFTGSPQQHGSLAQHSMLNWSGSVWTIDSKSVSEDPECERLQSSGDCYKVRELVIKDAPLEYITKILTRSQLTENVTIVHLESLAVAVREICIVLEKLTKVEQLTISLKKEHNNWSHHKYLIEDFQTFRREKEYFESIRSQFKHSMEAHPQRLKTLKICLPMVWQCSLVCSIIYALMDDINLEVLNISTSLQDMLTFLVASTEPNITLEEESTWLDFLNLGCKNLLLRSNSYLTELSISCADTFPLEYLRITSKLNTSIGDIFRWCFFCTAGIIDSLPNGTEIGGPGPGEGNNNAVFPRLKSFHLNLPFIPIPMSQNDELRQPLNILMNFLSKNNHLQQVVVLGLRPVGGMEYWIKHSLITLPKHGMKIGCTYNSTTLAKNMPVYDNELVSLAFAVVPEESRHRVSEFIEPYGKDTIAEWRYLGMKYLQIVNQLPSLLSFDVPRITAKFNRLTTLVLEDLTINFDEHGIISLDSELLEDPSQARSLTDADLQKIFQKLVNLEQLHLSCNMTKVTDLGLTGVPDSLWCRVTQRDKVYSFWFLHNLKYIFLRGFGAKVTDKSAIYALSEEYSLKKLQELHAYAPGFTNYGKDKIRRAFEGRKDFILKL